MGFLKVRTQYRGHLIELHCGIAGHTQLRWFCFVIFPVLLALHCCTITWAIWREPGARLASYFDWNLQCCGSKAEDSRISVLDDLPCLMMRVQMPFACGIEACGAGLMMLNQSWPALCDVAGRVAGGMGRSDCCDPMLRLTLATVITDSAWEWVYVFFAFIAIILLLSLIQKRGFEEFEQRSNSLHHTLIWFADSIRSPEETAINEWMKKADIRQTERFTPRRQILFVLLHIPCALVAAIPASAYILARKFVLHEKQCYDDPNSVLFCSMPQDEWSAIIMGNAFLIASFKACIMNVFSSYTSRCAAIEGLPFAYAIVGSCRETRLPIAGCLLECGLDSRRVCSLGITGFLNIRGRSLARS